MEASSLSFTKYHGQILEIIYLDRKNRITQRNIKLLSADSSRIKAYCFSQKGPRLFAVDRILSFRPVR